jgi:aspartate aminotransferase
MLQLSNRVQQLDESATLKMAQLARNLKAQGAPVISLTLGEPDFDTPEHIKAAATAALAAGYTKYTPVAGLPELREAICMKFRRDNQLEFKPENIVVSNGAKQSFANICNAVLNPKDEVVVIAPYWVSYKEIIELAEGVPVFVSADIEQDYKITAAQLRAALNERTRMLIFSSPCNPTGAVFTRQELQAFADVLRDFPNVLVVSDEIYEYINFLPSGHASIAHVADAELMSRLAIINGFSKGFAMTGWRLGYIAAPKALADACTKIQGQCTSGASSFGQKAAVTALTAGRATCDAMNEAFRSRRDLFSELLAPIDGFKCNMPDGAFYVFPDISALLSRKYKGEVIGTAENFASLLLNEAHVATVSGEGFGAPNCLRLSYATSETELREAARRIAAFVGELVVSNK